MQVGYFFRRAIDFRFPAASQCQKFFLALKIQECRAHLRTIAIGERRLCSCPCLSQRGFATFEFSRRDVSRFEASLQRGNAGCRALQLRIREIRLEPHNFQHAIFRFHLRDQAAAEKAFPSRRAFFRFLQRRFNPFRV